MINRNWPAQDEDSRGIQVAERIGYRPRRTMISPDRGLCLDPRARPSRGTPSTSRRPAIVKASWMTWPASRPHLRIVRQHNRVADISPTARTEAFKPVDVLHHVVARQRLCSLVAEPEVLTVYRHFERTNRYRTPPPTPSAAESREPHVDRSLSAGSGRSSSRIRHLPVTDAAATRTRAESRPGDGAVRRHPPVLRSTIACALRRLRPSAHRHGRGADGAPINRVDAAEREDPLPLGGEAVVVLEYEVDQLCAVQEAKILTGALR